MEQTFVTGLAIGLFVGWFVEFLIDLFYWRRGDSASGIAAKQVQDANLSLATANQHITVLDTELVELSTRNGALNAALSASRREVENLRAQLATIAAQDGQEAFQESAESPNDALLAEDALDDFMAAASQTVANNDEPNLDAFRTAAADVSI